jgi:hypothetical protein
MWKQNLTRKIKKVCFRAMYLAVVAVEFLEELLPTRRS